VARRWWPVPDPKETMPFHVRMVGVALAAFVGVVLIVQVVSLYRIITNSLLIGICLGILVGLAVYLVGVMAHEALTVRELVKQIAICIGVVTLLPLAVWYGTNVYSAPPDWKAFNKAES
jgi:uncharacterized membrane protein